MSQRNKNHDQDCKRSLLLGRTSNSISKAKRPVIYSTDEIVETGYAGTELGDWGFYAYRPEKLSEEIHGRNLVLLGAFVPVFLKDPSVLDAGVEIAVRTARLLAGVEGNLPLLILSDDNARDPARRQNAGRVTPEMGLSDSEWEIYARAPWR